MKKIMLMAVVAFFAAFNAHAQEEEFMIDGSKGKLSAVIVKPELKPGEK